MHKIADLPNAKRTQEEAVGNDWDCTSILGDERKGWHATG